MIEPKKRRTISALSVPKPAYSIRGGEEKIAVPGTGYRTLEALLAAVRDCRACEARLPLGPRPVLRAGETARILIVGQAPQAVAGRNGQGVAGVRSAFHPAAPPVAAQSALAQAPSLV